MPSVDLDDVQRRAEQALAESRPDPRLTRSLGISSGVACGVLAAAIFLLISMVGPQLIQRTKPNRLPRFWSRGRAGEIRWLPHWPVWSKWLLAAAGAVLLIAGLVGLVNAVIMRRRFRLADREASRSAEDIDAPDLRR